MRDMIQSYEEAREKIQNRIKEIEASLKDRNLMNGERDKLLMRRDILRAESYEVLHVINDMKAHLQEASQ